jgi:Ca2+-binding RTX toxin-like protein
MCFGQPATFVGTLRHDVQDGTPGADVFVLLSGPDTVSNAFRGDDFLCGNRGDDTLVAGAGDDTVLGGLGPDSLLAKNGDDVVMGQGGADLIHSDEGQDRMSGGPGNDLVGNPTTFSDFDRDRLYGDDGDDTLRALDGTPDVLHGGPGVDTCYADPIDHVRSCEIMGAATT